MNALEQLKKEKGQMLSKISKAALEGNAESVLKDCAKLEQVESLIRRYTGLVNEIESLSNQKEIANLPRLSENVINQNSISRGEAKPKNGREFGRIIRETFLEKLHSSGIELQHVKGVVYKNSRGNRIGIAAATEQRPDRWFLGLTKGSFDIAVLLCQSEILGDIEICIPKEFFEKYSKLMSISGEQIKFNIVRKGKTFNILVPGTGGVSVSEFLGGYSILR
jgi:hypothetical protein